MFIILIVAKASADRRRYKSLIVRDVFDEIRLICKDLARSGFPVKVPGLTQRCYGARRPLAAALREVDAMERHPVASRVTAFTSLSIGLGFAGRAQAWINALVLPGPPPALPQPAQVGIREKRGIGEDLAAQWHPERRHEVAAIASDLGCRRDQHIEVQMLRHHRLRSVPAAGSRRGR